METQTPERADSNKLRVVYWVAAAAMTVAVVLEVMKQPVNWLSVGSRAALIVALVLLATAKPAETRGKKLALYTLIAISIGLLLARIAGLGA